MQRRQHSFITCPIALAAVIPERQSRTPHIRAKRVKLRTAGFSMLGNVLDNVLHKHLSLSLLSTHPIMAQKKERPATLKQAPVEATSL